MPLIFFIHSSADGRLGYLHVLAVVNSAAVNTGARVSLHIVVLPGYMHSTGVTGSCGSSTFSCF